MKKFVSFLVLFLILATAVSAANDYQGFPIVKVTYNGDEVVPENVPGINLNGTTMIPLNMLRQMGFNVTWDNQTKTVDVSTGEQKTSNKRVLSEREIQSLDKAVAYIEILYEGNYYHGGSGFIINSNGLLITNHHVAHVEGEFRAMRVEVDGEIYHVDAGEYLFADEQRDLYGVYLDGDNFPYLKINTSLPEKGDVVYSLGHPNGERYVLTKGEVASYYSRMIPLIHIINHTADTAPGSSGSPLLNQYGEVIGVDTWGSSELIQAHSAVSSYSIQDLYDQSFNQ